MNNLFESIIQSEDISLDKTQDKILDAALQESAARGFYKITMDGVAKRSKMNRATVHRQFGSREGLQSALLAREGRRVAKMIRRSVEAHEDPETVFIEGFVTAIKIGRDHPLIAHLAKYEPGTLISVALENDSALLRIGGAFMANAIRWAQSKGRATHLDADSAGETAARLFSSFVLIPGGHNNLKNDETTRHYAMTTLVPMFLGSKPRVRVVAD